MRNDVLRDEQRSQARLGDTRPQRVALDAVLHLEEVEEPRQRALGASLVERRASGDAVGAAGRGQLWETQLERQ
jgi:hypothetical protein